MRTLILFGLILVCFVFSVAIALAEEATVDITSDNVMVSDSLLTIAVALPGDAVGKRVDSAVLEIPLTVSESADSAFILFPLVEIRESGSDTPKKTILLTEAFSGVARIDVARFVRAWSTTDEHDFLLGALSEGNATVFELGTQPEWASGVKARLVIRYSSLDGGSAAAD